MKHIIYFSSSAVTSGKAISDADKKGNLMKAGRMDIVLHSIIASLFLSHEKREDVRVHLIFYGPPESPKHIEISINPELDISKKDIGSLIKKILYKSSGLKKQEKKQVFPGVFVEKKSFLDVINDLLEKEVGIFILDKKGENIRNLKFNNKKDIGFIIGDQEGLPDKEIKRLVKNQKIKKISIGPKMYFASQSIVILLNELDIRDF